MQTRVRVYQYMRRHGIPTRPRGPARPPLDEMPYGTLHRLMSSRVPETGVCADCGQAGPTCLSNLDGEYSDDPATWGRKCPSCNRNDGVPIHPRFNRNGSVRGSLGRRTVRPANG